MNTSDKADTGELDIGDTVQDFTLPCVKCGEFRLSDKVKESPVLLYFYPVNYGKTCTNYIGIMNEMYDEFENIGITVFHVNPDSAENHETWMDRVGSKYDHISDTDQNISKKYGMIITHPEHPAVMGFTNRGFVLIDKEMTVRYIWRAERPIHTVDLKTLIDEISDIL
jgi:peroxiredoxin Q/BCP